MHCASPVVQVGSVSRGKHAGLLTLVSCSLAFASAPNAVVSGSRPSPYDPPTSSTFLVLVSVSGGALLACVLLASRRRKLGTTT